MNQYSVLKVSSMVEIEEPFELKSRIKATSPLSPAVSQLSDGGNLTSIVRSNNQHNRIIAPRSTFMWQVREREREKEREKDRRERPDERHV